MSETDPGETCWLQGFPNALSPFDEPTYQNLSVKHATDSASIVPDSGNQGTDRQHGATVPPGASLPLYLPERASTCDSLEGSSPGPCAGVFFGRSLMEFNRRIKSATRRHFCKSRYF